MAGIFLCRQVIFCLLYQKVKFIKLKTPASAIWTIKNLYTHSCIWFIGYLCYLIFI